MNSTQRLMSRLNLLNRKMKKFRFLIILAALLMAASCGEEQGTIETTAPEITETVETEAETTALIPVEPATVTVENPDWGFPAHEIEVGDTNILTAELNKNTGNIAVTSHHVGETEITGFEQCVMFGPMIGTIPFIGYIFKLADGADVEAFKTVLKENCKFSLYGNRLQADDMTFFFDDVSVMTVLGKNKLNIYADKELLQMKGSKRFNALKYVNFFHRYKNIKEGKNNEFLGL